MCDIIQDRIRINKILALVIEARLNDRKAGLDDVTELCLEALRLFYERKCPEECILAKARDFAAWQMARRETAP